MVVKVEETTMFPDCQICQMELESTFYHSRILDNIKHEILGIIISQSYSDLISWSDKVKAPHS